MARAPGGTLMVAPAAQGIDLFKIAGRSFSGSHGIRNELAEEFAKGKEMCLDIQERKKVTCNQEA